MDLTAFPLDGGDVTHGAATIQPLFDGNGEQYSYALHMPLESRMDGSISTAVLELPRTTLLRYQLALEVDGTTIAIPAGKDILTLDSAWRGRKVRFDFNIGPYPTGDGSGDGELTPSDAQYAFDAYIDPTFFDFLNPAQRAALDVNCDGSITPGDAQSIFEAYLGLRTLVPCPSGTPPAPGPVTPVGAAVALAVGSASTSAGLAVTVPITLNTTDSINAFGLRLNFDPARIEFISISAADTIAQNWYSIDGKLAQSGQVNIGGYRGTAAALTGQGPLVHVMLYAKATASGTVALTLSDLVDDVAGASTQPGYINISGGKTAVPGRWPLYK
jgi:hypothetical protein